MPFYYRIDGKTEEGRRTAANLLRLRDQLDDEIPQKTVLDTLLLATWNIREFDSAKYGPRLPESYYYIAEIVSRFDIVAIQEVRDDLAALDELKNILGSWWDYIVTDVCFGRQGNCERLAFLYDRRKIRFTGLAGEVVLPSVKKDSKEYTPAKQLARTPFICGFAAGWAKFNLCTVHIIYGSGAANAPERVEEITQLCELLTQKSNEQAKNRENLILLGDFNIFSREDETMKPIRENFTIPEALQSVPGSNVAHDKFYDQIAFIQRTRLAFSQRAGVFDFYDSVFPESESDLYLPIAQSNYKEKTGKQLAEGDWPGRDFREWRTYQMSDHLPMWVEMKIEFGKEYLQAKKGSP